MSTSVSIPAAERALGRLAEMSADLRSCAIVDASAGVLAESGENDWRACAEEIWSAAGELPGGPVTQVHVATDVGELFAARAGGLSVLALTARHALASLMFCDLRSVLREVGS